MFDESIFSTLSENTLSNFNFERNNTILEDQKALFENIHNAQIVGVTDNSLVAMQANLMSDSLSTFPTAVVGSLLKFNSDSIPFDSSLTIEDYYVIAQVDANSSVLERDETENLFIKSLTLTQADLIIESLPELMTVTLSQTLVFDYTLKNQGTAKSKASETDFFLSQDHIIDENDRFLGTNLVGSLKSGRARSRKVALNISSEIPSGNYYLLARADHNNNILESDETNNVFSGAITINLVDEINSNVVYNSTSGYGTVNAAAAVARVLGKTEFANVVNLGGNNWGADLIKAPEVWKQGYTGQGIVVAILDTGVARNHPDLNSNIWQNNDEIANNGVDDDLNGFVDDVYGWNFADNSNNTLDVRNHGTHVAGTITGVKNNFGVTGIAYNAKIMPVKVFNDQGSGTYSSLIQGIYYAVDNGAKIINMSLGGSSNLEDLENAIEYASSKGVIVVSAAGNANASIPDYPAQYAINDGIAVGAVNKSNKRAGFSNKAGNDPNMAYVNAPGVNVYSTLANNGYGSLSGTSMATPHVAGVVALMLSANRNLTDSQVRQILIKTSIPLA
jgi:hypothetical protein